jgi:hypothetical protein
VCEVDPWGKSISVDVLRSIGGIDENKDSEVCAEAGPAAKVHRVRGQIPAIVADVEVAADNLLCEK